MAESNASGISKLITCNELVISNQIMKYNHVNSKKYSSKYSFNVENISSPIFGLIILINSN